MIKPENRWGRKPANGSRCRLKESRAVVPGRGRRDRAKSRKPARVSRRA